MTLLARGCRVHRGALEALVLHAERGAATPAALDHLETCPTCERDLTELALTVAALRRAGRELRASPVPAPPRSSVAALTARPRSGWSWRLQVGGLLTGAAIAALVVAPRSGGAAWPASDAGQPVARAEVVAGWRQAEDRIAAEPDTPSFAATGTVPPRYPEGLLRPWKEVPATDASRRGFIAR
jgi:hypothetical protein